MQSEVAAISRFFYIICPITFYIVINSHKSIRRVFEFYLPYGAIIGLLQ